MCDDDDRREPRVSAEGMFAGELPFACACCGTHATATVIGDARVSIEGEGEKAELTVRRMASAEARLDAERLVSIARCPICGRRSRSALVRVAARSVSAGLSIGISFFVGALIWCIVADLRLPDAADQPAIIAALIAAGVSGFVLVRYFQRSSHVVF